MLRQATRWLFSVLSRLLVLAPVLALLPAALLDIGPDGTVRASIFPLVLTAYDSLLRTSMVNSLAVSAGVAAGSVALGGILGRILYRCKFWGRPFLAAAVSAPAVVPPAFLALGLLGLWGESGPAPWTQSWARFSATGSTAHSWPWLLWIWAALIQGVALVVISSRAAFDRLDPDLEDAARLAGAAPMRIWWALLWPMLRPALAATGGLVFVLNLADPGAPLVLGLRRTLAFQIVTSALRTDPFPRLAAAGLIVLLVAMAGGALALRPARAYRGAELEHDPSSGRSLFGEERRARPARDAPRVRALAWSLLLFAWSLLAWSPVAGLLWMSLKAGSHSGSAGYRTTPFGTSLLHSLVSDPFGRLVFHSAVLGLSVFAIVAVLVRWPAKLPQRRALRSGNAPGHKRWGRNLFIESMPPLVVGIGMLALLRVAELLGRWLVTSLGLSGAGASVERLATELQPARMPEILLVVGVCLAVLPRRLWRRRGAVGSEEARARRVDQAVLSGAGSRRAKSLAQRGTWGIPTPTAVLWATLAATSIAPAVLLAPSFASLPIGPGIVVLADQPESGRARASLLALLAIGAQLSALGWAGVWDRPRGELTPVDLA